MAGSYRSLKHDETNKIFRISPECPVLMYCRTAYNLSLDIDLLHETSILLAEFLVRMLRKKTI